jgi:hypothetical protein
MSEKEKKTRKLAGFFRQLGILFWKNGILFKRNKVGTFAEILMAFIFIILLIAIRFFVDAKLFTEQDITSNPPRYFLANATLQKGKFAIYVSPNNVFVLSLVANALNDIKSQNKNFTIFYCNYFHNNLYLNSLNNLLNLKVFGTDSTSASDVNFNSTLAFIVFPSSYTSAANKPDNISYTIYSQEMATTQYNIGAQFYSMTDLMYTDSPQSYCRSMFEFFDIDSPSLI